MEIQVNPLGKKQKSRRNPYAIAYTLVQVARLLGSIGSITFFAMRWHAAMQIPDNAYDVLTNGIAVGVGVVLCICFIASLLVWGSGYLTASLWAEITILIVALLIVFRSPAFGFFIALSAAAGLSLLWAFHQSTGNNKSQPWQPKYQPPASKR